MNHSEVMQNLEHLTDVIGPRLTGSPAMRRANEWTAARFQAYGLSAKLEPYEFGVTWERGDATLPSARAVQPGDHRPQLGLDRGHRRKEPGRSGGAHRSLHPGEPRRVQAPR